MHRVQWVGERHPVEYSPRVEILTQDHGHLPEAGDRPDLGVVVAEQVLADAPQGFEHHGAGERQYREGEHEALDLPLYCFWIRPGLELSQARAPEFEEDMRREDRGSGATDAPEHLPGTLTFVWLPAVQGVDEQIKEPERLRDGNRGSGPPGGCPRQPDRESLEEAQKLLCMAVWPSPERSANAKDGRLTRG